MIFLINRKSVIILIYSKGTRMVDAKMKFTSGGLNIRQSLNDFGDEEMADSGPIPSQGGKQLAFPSDVADNFEQGHMILFRFLYDSRVRGTGNVLNKVAPLVKGDSASRNVSGGINKSKIVKGIQKAAKAVGATGAFKSFDMKRTSKTVAMYMPAEVRTQYGHSYQEAKHGALMGAMGENAEAVGGIIAGGIQSIKDIFTLGGLNMRTGFQGFKQIQKEAQDLKLTGALEAMGTEAMLGTGIGFVGATMRQIVNPRMEMLYQQTEPRNFTYTFKMNPSSEKEANTIKEIVHMFKVWSHPSMKKSSGGGSILRYPGEFEIEFMSYGAENTYINRVHDVVCTSVGVDYSTEGTFQAHRANDKGAPPVTTTLSLGFKETEMLTADMIHEGGF